MIVSGGVAYHPALKPLLEPITKITPHPENPNNGDEEAIAGSIEVNGMYRPVEAQLSTGYILAGNTTYAACLDLGAELIPILWLDVDDETALRILLGDNQLARLARIDQGLLQPQLDALLATELGLLGTGFTEPVEVIEETEPGHTVSAWLSGERLVQWFELPGDNDRQRLIRLLEEAEERRFLAS